MYLTVPEVASRLHISVSSVYLLIENGHLAHHRFGARRGAIRISEVDLDAYLTECREDRSGKRVARPPFTPSKLKHIKL